jgi:hypothetical protein
MKKVLKCPKNEELVGNPCQDKVCAYRRSSEPNGCGYAKITAITKNFDLDKAVRKEAIAKIYKLDVEDVNVALKRVVSVVCLSEYFEYAYSKSVLDAKKKELEDLKLSIERYQAWKANSKKIPFSSLVESIDFLLINLR